VKKEEGVIMKEHSGEVTEKLENAMDNHEACNTQRDNGYDPEEFLDDINGGAKPGVSRPKPYQGFFSCPKCHNYDKTLFDKQVLDSMWGKETKYLCKKCGSYFKVSIDGRKITLCDK
jgi:hypothetical protein